ncbi:MAG: hypothetical protein ABIA93_06385 [Candidatus Woesearchaeota archaeon]
MKIQIFYLLLATVILASCISNSTEIVNQTSNTSGTLQNQSGNSTILPIEPPQGTPTGIIGTVLLGPTCPVIQYPPNPKCADKPYQTTLMILQGGEEIATVESDANGQFAIYLGPGNYTIRPVVEGDSRLPFASDMTVLVGRNGWTNVTVQFDTGIR